MSLLTALVNALVLANKHDMHLDDICVSYNKFSCSNLQPCVDVRQTNKLLFVMFADLQFT